MKLYTYFRSSSAFRVRIALNLKRLPYEAAAVHLRNNGGEQRSAGFVAINPQALLPVLDEDGAHLTQSLAIIEYLDETHPAPPLLPADAQGRARVRALCQMMACDMHPLSNLRVLQYLGGELQLAPDQVAQWNRHWTGLGLAALERTLAEDSRTGRFCHGDTPGMADCCLVPQVFNARRFECELAPYPTVMRIVQACMEIAAFQAASPERQFDAE